MESRRRTRQAQPFCASMVTLYETPYCMLRDIQCPGGRSIHEWYALHTFGLPMTSKWAAPMASARVTTSRATRMNTGPLASHKVHVKPPSWKATACPAITRRTVEPVSGTAPERYGYHGHREPRAAAAGACMHSRCRQACRHLPSVCSGGRRAARACRK